MTDLFATTENRGAEFSADKKYRYALWRIWDESKPIVMFIGLNPSIANGTTDDPTIQSVRRISQHNGYGGFYMMNLFTIISSDPKILENQNSWGDFINDKERLTEVSKKCESIVFAWGNIKQAQGRGSEIIAHFLDALCIGKNKNNSPKHPLYQNGYSKLTTYVL